MTTSLKKAVANALSFAHLASVGRAKPAAKADNDGDKDEPERDHEDGDARKAKKAESDKPDEDDKDKDAKSAKAEDDDESMEGDDQPDSDDGDEDDDGDKKGKKARAPDGDDDDKDEEMRGKSAVAQGRLREQARCAAIFASPAAARNPVLAANLAFKSRMGRTEALGILEGTPAAAAPVNTARAARNPNVGAGGSAQPTSQQAVAASWDQAFAKVNPTRR